MKKELTTTNCPVGLCNGGFGCCHKPIRINKKIKIKEFKRIDGGLKIRLLGKIYHAGTEKAIIDICLKINEIVKRLNENT